MPSCFLLWKIYEIVLESPLQVCCKVCWHNALYRSWTILWLLLLFLTTFESWLAIPLPFPFPFHGGGRNQQVMGSVGFIFYYWHFPKHWQFFYFSFLKYICMCKDKSKSSALFLNGFLHLFLFYSFYCLPTTSLTKTEMNGIPFWKGMRNRCKHVCIREGILWNLFNWKSKFRKIFDAGSLLNCYQRHSRITIHLAIWISK